MVGILRKNFADIQQTLSILSLVTMNGFIFICKLQIYTDIPYPINRAHVHIYSKHSPKRHY